MSEKISDSVSLNIKYELEELLKLIISNKDFFWREKAEIWKIKPNSCSSYVRNVLYNQIWQIKWIVWNNKFWLIWNASNLFKENKSEIFQLDEYLLEQIKEDWIYDIAIKEYKKENNRQSYHRIFVVTQNKKFYTIDPFYDSDNDIDDNLNNTEILELEKWENYFFKTNKKNATFKILAKYWLNEIKIRN